MFKNKKNNIQIDNYFISLFKICLFYMSSSDVFILNTKPLIILKCFCVLKKIHHSFSTIFLELIKVDLFMMMILNSSSKKKSF